MTIGEVGVEQGPDSVRRSCQRPAPWEQQIDEPRSIIGGVIKLYIPAYQLYKNERSRIKSAMTLILLLIYRE